MTRIIAGSAKGQRLATPSGVTTRPTSDQAREAFFSGLASWAGTLSVPVNQQLAGITVLDCFAGSAGIGLEAASRGADQVILIEKDPKACAVIKQNLKTTGLSARLVCQTVEQFLNKPAAQKFDVIWMDPPYALPNEQIVVLADLIVANGWLVADGLLAIERSSRNSAPEISAATYSWSKRYGEAEIHYFRFDN